MVKLYDDLVITKQRRTKKAMPKISRHVGFDTETYQGKAFLLCAADNFPEGGGTRWSLEIPFNDHKTKGLHRIMSWMTIGVFRNSLNWFYNLDYDVRAILKWCPDAAIKELYDTRNCKVGGYSIEYLPGKMFTIKDPHKHVFRFFDIAQFYGGSLDNNAKKYLGDKKIDTIDRIRLGYDSDYWQANKEDIVKYCKHDARLTARLGGLLYQQLSDVMGFSSLRPYSTGSVAQEYFLANANIPTIDSIPEDILRLHQDGYRGGRIELLQKGYFPSCNGYDIKSAYPAVMRDLLDYSQGEWIADDVCRRRGGVVAGIYEIEIDWYHEKVAPFPVDDDTGTIYPNGSIRTIVNEKEINFLRKYKYYNDFEIIRGYEFIPYREVYPYRELIDYLFEQKETTTDATKRLLYKLFINSIYGKTAQAIDKRPKNSEEPLKYHTGNLWNPIYANRITSLTRLKLLEHAMPIIDKVIGFSTDSIHTTAKMNVPSNPVIGDFTEEYIDKEGVFLMAGVRIVGEEEKIRGFGGKVSLRELLSQNPDKRKIPVYVDKPVTIFEAFNTHRYNPDDLNVFIPQKKVLDINGDVRRIWQGDFTCAKEVLEMSYSSSPIFV